MARGLELPNSSFLSLREGFGRDAQLETIVGKRSGKPFRSELIAYHISPSGTCAAMAVTLFALFLT